MNRFIKVAMLLSIVTVLLTALSFKTAEARTNVSPCQVCQGRFIPQSGSPPFTFLSGVAAVSANDIWASGFSSNGNSSSQTLIEHWNGKQWSIISSPNPGSISNALGGIGAVSASDIWAIGISSNTNNSSQTLIEHWNGSNWGIVKSPNPGSLGNSLGGVAAVSANNVWAVGGSSNNNTSGQTLIEHWNGSNWGIVKSPSPGSAFVSLNDVAVVSTNNIWAVGSSNTSSTTLIEHWNGTQWSVVKSPNPRQINLLDGIAVVSASNIWAVGQSLAGPGGQTLIEHWNGTKWSVVTSPNQPGSVNNFLGGIAVVSASNIWAVGGFQSSSLAGYTLIENWDGSKWSVVKSPNTLTRLRSIN